MPGSSGRIDTKIHLCVIFCSIRTGDGKQREVNFDGARSQKRSTVTKFLTLLFSLQHTANTTNLRRDVAASC